MQTSKNLDYLNPEFSKVLENLTKYVSKPLGFNKIYNEEQIKKREVEYASSLPLQIIVYYNVYYSIFWAIGTCFLWPILVYRADESTRVWIILILFAFIMMVIFEIIRLYLAYIGNLGERVPELTGFWLLTLMIEIPLSTFLLAIVWIPIGSSNYPLQIVYLIPLQFSLQVIHTIFVYLEVIFGFFALRVLARYQISRFHYKQFDKGFQPNNNNEDDDDDGIVKEKDVDWLDSLKNNYYSMKTLNPDLKAQ